MKTIEKMSEIEVKTFAEQLLLDLTLAFKGATPTIELREVEMNETHARISFETKVKDDFVNDGWIKLYRQV